jgi:hemerythrin-like domain-containing protein
MSKQTATQTQTDIRLYRAVHEMFRRYTTRLVDATAKLEPSALETVIRPNWEVYTALLDHHHHTEDASIFPALVGVRPDLRSTIDELEDEHVELAPNIDAVNEAVAAFATQPDAIRQQALHGALTALRDWFFPHLDVEDQRVLPAIAESIPQKQWDQIDKAALKSIPRAYVPFAVAALDEVIESLPQHDRPAPPPPPIRIMLSLSWRKRWRTQIEPISV